jgi:hypothetical protein
VASKGDSVSYFGDESMTNRAPGVQDQTTRLPLFLGFSEIEAPRLDERKGQSAQILSPKVPDDETRLLAKTGVEGQEGEG